MFLLYDCYLSKAFSILRTGSTWLVDDLLLLRQLIPLNNLIMIYYLLFNSLICVHLTLLDKYQGIVPE